MFTVLMKRAISSSYLDFSFVLVCRCFSFSICSFNFAIENLTIHLFYFIVRVASYFLFLFIPHVITVYLSDPTPTNIECCFLALPICIKYSAMEMKPIDLDLNT